MAQSGHHEIERVMVEGGAVPEEVAAVQGLLKRWGFEIDVEAGVPLSGGPPVDYVWIVYVWLAVPIASFFEAFGAEAGRDAYTAAKAWIRDIFDTRRTIGEPGEIALAAPDGSHLRLSTALPSEALDALREIDWSNARGGLIYWEPDRKEWLVWTEPDDHAEA